MKVLILGAGNMGRGIATRVLAGRNDVTLYDINPDTAHALAAELVQGRAGSKVAVTTTPAVAASASDIVILASWYRSNLELARTLSAALAGKIVVDISNPLNENYDGLVTPPGTSAAETIQAVLPASASVVKAFNTTFAGTLAGGQVADQPLDVFLASDSPEARSVVAGLVRAGGLNPVEVGALHRSRQLEALALLGITLQQSAGTGFMSGWKFLVPTGMARSVAA